MAAWACPQRRSRHCGRARLSKVLAYRNDNNLMLRRLPLEYLGVTSAAVSKHGQQTPRLLLTLRDAALRAAPQGEVRLTMGRRR